MRTKCSEPRASIPEKPKSVSFADFSDAESQRVLTAATLTVAYELGMQAGIEYFDQLLAQRESLQ
jgi:hypothetical protein